MVDSLDEADTPEEAVDAVRDSLESIAGKDLPASWVAEGILEAYPEESAT